MQLYSFLCYKAEQIKFLFSHENELDEKSSRKKMAFLRTAFDQRESSFATYFESIKCKLDSHFMNRSEELWTRETLSQTFVCPTTKKVVRSRLLWIRTRSKTNMTIGRGIYSTGSTHIYNFVSDISTFWVPFPPFLPPPPLEN